LSGAKPDLYKSPWNKTDSTVPRKTNNQPDVARALNAVRRLVRGLRSAAEAVERDLKISAAQLFVLRELERTPDQSVKDLAGVTMTTHSTVSQVVAQLIAKGLVVRTADALDGRRAVLRVSRRGTQLLSKAPRAIQEVLIDGFAMLRPAERRGLASGLEKWLAATGLSGVPSSMLFEKPTGGVKGRSRKRGQ
jgi:DNA-binding MarR family transcriptional regulator